MKKFKNSGQFQKGGTPWIKGKTKKINEIVLNSAIKRTGQKRKKYLIPCPICEKKFNQFGIKSHIRFGHERDNPFKGKKHTKEANQKNREKHLGNTAWNYERGN